MGILERMFEGWEYRYWEKDGNFGKNGVRVKKKGIEKRMGILERMLQWMGK